MNAESNKDLRNSNHDASLLEEKYGSLLESAPDAIVIVNADGRIVLANRHAEQLFRYGQRELLGQLIEVLIPERYRSAHTGHRSLFFSQPRTRPMGAGLELNGLCKDGAEFPVEISLSPVATHAGVMVMSAIRDITQRKGFERELREKNAALEKANAELEAFCYSVSHDLRAPVRAMSGYAAMLTKKFGEQLSPEWLSAVERIRINATQMGQLIDGLLSFSRLSRQELVKKQFDPTALARSVCDEMRGENRSRRIDFQVAELPDCQADPTLLRQIFTNLLSNAVKYSRDRDPAIVEVGALLETGETVYFVKDNGAGFNMEYADKLFRVFQRLHSREEFDGTGVGLATVSRIVERHGGRVWAEGEPGKGATFYFTLAKANSDG